MGDVPGVKAEDMEIEVKEDQFISIKGKRNVKSDGIESESIFEKNFNFGKKVDVEHIEANLSDGVLTITAPKIKREENVRKVFIRETKKEEEEVNLISENQEENNLL